MVVDYNLSSFSEWFYPSAEGSGALVQFIFTLAVLALGGVLLGYVVSVWRHGFIEGFYVLAQSIVEAPKDLFGIALKRVMAIATLAIQESIRKRVMIVFGVFVLIMLIAGWYLDVRSDRPSELYLSFVMTAANFLITGMALFISAFSLPSDIQNRTIYTVVTKPVRSSEIVLGRIIGFIIVGTGLLTLMAVISYFFVVRGLSHSHTVAVAETEKVGNRSVVKGKTTFDSYHEHTFQMPEGSNITQTDSVMGHTHLIEKRADGEYYVGPPDGSPPQGRVPLYGKLSFLNRTGGEGKGVNVGYEWEYRQYVEGGTLAAAIWEFDGITPERFPDGLPLEMTLSVFRTHKGDIERGVLGEITILNPDPTARIQASRPISFVSREFETHERFVPRTIAALTQDAKVIEADLFKDLVSDGKVRVKLQCADPQQYFGVAQADLYVKADQKWFVLNFMKGYLHIWMQMVIVTSFGVMLSTFLSGPVALISTIATFVLGIFTRFIAGVFGEIFESNQFLVRMFGTVPGAEDKIPGGGPIESMIRLFTQKNLTTELDLADWLIAGIRGFDIFSLGVIYTFTQLLPDFRLLNRSSHVAKGFDIPPDLMLQNGLTTLAFVCVLSVVGYFFLKSREIAA